MLYFSLAFLLVTVATEAQQNLRHAGYKRRLGACAESDSRSACRQQDGCVWVRGLCQTKTSWNGFTEVGQTHVVKAHGETRHAPKIIADREAELLFFPTQNAPPTIAPSAAPTDVVDLVFGLEKVGDFTVDLPSSSDVWPSPYPRDKSRLIDGSESHYGIPASLQNINFNFDLHSDRAVQGVYIKTWWYSSIDSIKIGLRHDDGADLDDPQTDTTVPEGDWVWIDGGSYLSGCNEEVLVTMDLTAARYVQIQVRGGWRGSDQDSEWGIRKIQISGYLDGTIVGDTNDNEEETNPIDGVAFFPNEPADVLVEAYDASGAMLGTIAARPTSRQRGISDQYLTGSTITPYSASRDMWSSTLPWQWVKEGTEIVTSVIGSDGKLLTHTLTLHNIAMWSEHSLIRQTFVIFGDDDQFDDLDTSTHDSDPLATGMFGIMPVSSLQWVDATVLHWPYLIISSNNGAIRINSESERQEALIASGNDPSSEPRWEVTKNMVAFRHSYANTGRGFTLTTLAASGNHGSPYSTHTTISMGWALVEDGEKCTDCEYKRLGDWGWAAAASLGWAGVKVGDEKCGGNLLPHELGHSMTLNHFTDGQAENWGIQDEYPEDGTHLNGHPWGYDTPSRQFRTWYDVIDGTSKKDPMNGGGSTSTGGCYPHYTGFHGLKSQKFGTGRGQLLSSEVSGVSSDGLYMYNPNTRSLEPTTPEARFMAPVETGVPVVTFIGTLGSSEDDTCQTYPPSIMRYGHTFEFPNPFGSDLDEVFEGAAYMVEVTFADGSSEVGLIASPDLRGSTELRFYSFNVPVTRNPTSVDLYRFDIDSYPNLTASSAKTLLESKPIVIPPSALESLPQVTKVGRGWLGNSGDVRLNRFCFGTGDCATKNTVLFWRGSDGASISFSTPLPNEPYGASATAITFAAEAEDGSMKELTVAASRMAGASGWVPFIGGNPAAGIISEDATHGVAFSLPYELNHLVPPGKYTALVPLATGTKAGVDFVNIRVMLDVAVPRVTDTVNLSDGQPWTSAPIPVDSSSVYFLTDDRDIGPTEEVWWGESFSTLTVPLLAPNCNNAEVMAHIRARNKCGGSYFQMNAGRGAEDCVEHNLNLELENEDANPWLVASLYQGCKFETRRVTPVTINAYKWHQPRAETLLETMHLQIQVDLSGPVVAESADLSDGLSWTSSPFSAESSSIYFLAEDQNIGPTEEVWWGESDTMLTVPLIAPRCNNAEVVARIRARNKCGDSYFGMNAGRESDDCSEHSLNLEMGTAEVNPWRKATEYKNCKFQTPIDAPVRIDAYRWHEPNAGAHLGSLSLHVEIELSERLDTDTGTMSLRANEESWSSTYLQWVGGTSHNEVLHDWS